MKNFIQPGCTVTVDSPAGGVSSGEGVLIGALFGIAAFSAPAAAPLEIATEGVFDLPKVTGETFAQGQKAYWDSTAKKVTSTVGSNAWIGVALQGVNGSATKVRVRLNQHPTV
jgi:predicted RecA/RadA family phage recombinase